MPGKKRAITEELFAAMLEAYRGVPGNASNCARVAGVNPATASRAWNTGWPNKPFARVPIKVLLEQEAAAARAKRIEMERKAAAEEAERALLARFDAIQARAEESQMAKASRKNATNLAVVSSKLVVLVDKLVARLQGEIEQNPQSFSMGEIRKWIGTMSVTMQRAEQVVRMALEIERVVTGEPIAVLGVRVDKMTPDDMVKELTGISRTLERAQGLADRRAEEDAAKLQREIEEARGKN